MNIIEENRKHLARVLKDRYTAHFVRDLAAQGTVVLKDIPRWEEFTGQAKVVTAADGTRVLIHRTQDYEFARFEPDEKAMIRACDNAIRSLGARLDMCLQGERIAKDFAGNLVRSELHPATWPGGSTLYSLGPAPRLLEHEEIVFFRIAKDGHDGSNDTMPILRDDILEARFAYYAATGPTE